MSKAIPFKTDPLVPINLRDGNLKDAIAFFKAASVTNIYNLCRESLVDGMKIGEEYFLIPWSYDADKDTFILHYEKRNPPLSVKGRGSFNVLLEVQKNFSFQLEISFYYLELKSKANTQVKSKKEYFKKIVNDLQQCCISLKSDSTYVNYQSEIIKPYLVLLTEIFETHKNFAPPISVEINDLYLEYPDFKSRYKKRNLEVKVIDAIFQLNDKKSDQFFEILFNSGKRAQLYKSFRNFFYGHFDKITTPIEFHGKSEAAYYLIFKLCQYLGYDETQIGESRNTIFTISGRPYSVSSAYSAKRRIVNRKNDFRNIIDSLIEANLS
jgi:hypothetical protein